MFMKYFAIAVFLAGYLLIISLPRHRAHVSIIGALLLFAAGAITGGGKGTAQGKMDALRAAGVQVGLNPTEAGDLMAAIVATL